MNISSDIITTVEDFIGSKITGEQQVGGGCIANSKIIRSESGNTYFLKTLASTDKMFLKEANGLVELEKAKAVRIPKVILAHANFLLLEHIQTGIKHSAFFNTFGRRFAQMHRHTSNSFGFFEDNFIGATPQINSASSSEEINWPEFYYNKRILAQLRFAEKNGYASRDLIHAVNKLESVIATVLSGSTEAPTLLHGDLWGGNYMCDSEGEAVLIDPAVYYGHREADLAMTKMFGGFSNDFYQSYQEEYPLSKGWEFREGIYLLYHYMNHLNLFGNSYYSQCINLLKKYV